MKLRSVSLPLAVPALFPFMESMNNTKRILFLVCAAVILLAAIQCIVCLFVSKKLTKKKLKEKLLKNKKIKKLKQD